MTTTPGRKRVKGEVQIWHPLLLLGVLGLALGRKRVKGEVQIWLAGMGLAVGCLMVGALLALILWRGLHVFWPQEVRQFTLEENGATTTVFAQVKGEGASGLRDGNDQPIPQLSLFIGHREVYGISFRTVRLANVVESSRPGGVIVADRMAGGAGIFQPLSLVPGEGREISPDDPEFEAELRRLVHMGNQLRADILKIERVEIGRVNDQIRGEERRLRAAQRANAENLKAVHTSVEANIGKLNEARQKLINQSAELRAKMDGVIIRYALGDGTEREQPVSEIVRFHFPNELGFFGKLGVFVSGLWNFLSQEPRDSNREGGVFPAIFGTFVMTILLAVMVTPFGVIAAIYLREYAKQGPLVRAVRICVNNLAGVPSIVFGVFGLGFFVYGVGGFIDGGSQTPWPSIVWMAAVLAFFIMLTLAILVGILTAPGPGRAPAGRFVGALGGTLWIGSAALLFVVVAKNPYFGGFFAADLPTPTFGTGGILWASLTLALMTLPVVIVATEESLSAVPRGVREAALACGASKWQTIQRIVLPGAAPGIMTGVILAMARGAGEVAPLMITGVVKMAPSLPIDGQFPFIHAERKFMHLGFHIYDLGFQSPDAEAAKPMVFATTLLLISLVVVMNLSAILIRNHLRRKYAASSF